MTAETDAAGMSERELWRKIDKFLEYNASNEGNQGIAFLRTLAARRLSRPAMPPEGRREKVATQLSCFVDGKSWPTLLNWADLILALLPLSPAAQAVPRDALERAWGAMNFVLAFYEPGQRYLDTNAWKQAEASMRRSHAELRELLDAAKAAQQEGERDELRQIIADYFGQPDNLLNAIQDAGYRKAPPHAPTS